MRSYRDRADKTFEETTKLYREATRLPHPNVALKNVWDYATDTLSLALEVGNKVSEVNVSLSKVPTSDIIHLNKEIGDILNTRLLKATIQLSKLEESKARTSNLLWKSKLEIKALKSQINNLQKEDIQWRELGRKGVWSRNCSMTKIKRYRL